VRIELSGTMALIAAVPDVDVVNNTGVYEPRPA
jgi:hypothetical protein